MRPPFVLLAALLPLSGAEDGLRHHQQWHEQLAGAASLNLEVGTFFGSEGTETLDGVVSLADDSVVAFGNSWGPPFPESPAPTVLGSGEPSGLPLSSPSMATFADGSVAMPSAHHPDRTGFLVRWNADLTALDRIVRFGWGLASIDAALADGDALIVAGRAGKGFEATFGSAIGERVPAVEGRPGMGPVSYQDRTVPGHVYVGRLNDDASGFAWIVLLEHHRRLPELYLGGKDRLLVTSSRSYLIQTDGTKVEPVRDLPAIDPRARRWIAGFRPGDGALCHVGTRVDGRWVGPRLEVADHEATEVRAYFDWTETLVANSMVGLTAHSRITAADCGADGSIYLAAESSGARSVIERDPVDLLEPIPHAGLGLDEGDHRLRRGDWRKGPGVAHLVRYHPDGGKEPVVCRWFAMDGYRAAEIGVDGIRALPDGRIAVWGESGDWLLQTTDDHYRARDHYVPEFKGYVAKRPKKKKGKEPPLLGVGGKGPYCAVFGADFASLEWSSAMARSRVAGVAANSRGVVVAATCTAAPEEGGDANIPATAHAHQDAFGGGRSDGHLYLLVDKEAR